MSASEIFAVQTCKREGAHSNHDLGADSLFQTGVELRGFRAESGLTRRLVAGPIQSRFKLMLIKNAHAIFSPDVINARHVLVGGTQIVGLLDDDAAEALEAVSQDIKTHIVDATNCILTPGFVDCHVHITGKNRRSLGFFYVLRMPPPCNPAHNVLLFVHSGGRILNHCIGMIVSVLL